MRIKKFSSIIVVLLIQIIIFTSIISIDNVTAKEIEPDFGGAPEIDGDIDNKVNEWINATKESITLLTNGSETDKGLPIDIWVQQNSSRLYVLVRFDLQDHKTEEFIGLLITEEGDDGEDDDEYVDAKIIQFTDINDDDYEYLDYYIEDEVFYEDDDEDGDGAAELDDDEVIYEFEIPINNTDDEDDDEDVFLDPGEEYAFKIIYGETPGYPDNIKKSNIVIISIIYPENPPPRNWWVDFHNVMSIIIYIAIASLFGFYIFKIIILNKKFERMTS